MRFSIVFASLGAISLLPSCAGSTVEQHVFAGSELDGGAWLHVMEATPRGNQVVYSTGTLLTGDASERSADPSSRTAAENTQGSIGVTILAPPESDANARLMAQEIAEILSTGTARLWPPGPKEISVSLTLLAPDSRPAPIRRFERGDDDPWELSFSLEESPQIEKRARSAAETVAHETYHLYATRYRLADLDAAMSTRRMSGRIFEESVAMIYGQCALLHADRPASIRGWPQFALRIEGRERSAPFDDQTLAIVLKALKDGHTPSGEPLPYTLHLGLNLTIFAELSGGSLMVSPHSRHAGSFLDFCTRYAPDPLSLEPWLQTVASDGQDAPVFAEPARAHPS